MNKLLNTNKMNDISPTNLSAEDWQLISESLKYAKVHFEQYQGYPSDAFKKEKIEKVTNLIKKIRELKKG